MNRLKLTKHARERLQRRFKYRVAFEAAVKLPKSVIGRFGWKGGRCGPGRTLWCTSSALILVGRQNLVVTLVQLKPEHFADVLVWKLMDTWP